LPRSAWERSFGRSAARFTSLALFFGDFLGVSATERRCLTSRLTLGLIELVTEGLILGHEIGN
jgi:hypothetical protein